MERELERKKKKAWRGYWTLSKVFKGNKVNIWLKTKTGLAVWLLLIGVSKCIQWQSQKIKIMFHV